LLPTCLLGVISQHQQRVRISTLRNVVFFTEGNKVVNNDGISVLFVEWSDIRDERRGKKDVTNDDLKELA
jgi:hypothetical protein